MIRTFYTTAEQEAELDEIYQKEVAEKQKEIEAEYKRTNKIYKYNATAYIHKKDRVFFVCEKGVFWVDFTTGNLTKAAEEGGKTYCFENDSRVKEFINKYKEYYVRFHVTTKYGPTVGYVGMNERIFPATFEANGDTVLIDTEDNYDIICG